MALTPAALDPVKPQVLHPRLAGLWLIRCQTSLNSLIYGTNFGNYVRVTDFLLKNISSVILPQIPCIPLSTQLL